MSAVAVDTHTVVWYLANDRRLSVKATNNLDSATAGGRVIHVPSICPIELTYLVEKRKLPSIARDRLVKALDDASAACRLAPLDRMVADALEFVDGSEIPDLPDRIVAATALAPQVPLISRDGKIRASKVQTIW